MTDEKFEVLLKRALVKAAEIDYMSTIPDENELDALIVPSEEFQRKMSELLQNPVTN